MDNETHGGTGCITAWISRVLILCVSRDFLVRCMGTVDVSRVAHGSFQGHRRAEVGVVVGGAHRGLYCGPFCVHTAPDTAGSLCGTLDIAALEGFYLCARGVQEELDLFLNAGDFEAVESNDFVTVIYCSGGCQRR